MMLIFSYFYNKTADYF